MLSQLPSVVKNGAAIMQMWRNWAYGLGSLAVILLVSLWVDPVWLPVVCYGMLLVFWAMVRFDNNDPLPITRVITVLINKVLLWSSTIMLVLALMWHYVPWERFMTVDIHNHYPYIPVLILAPVTTCFSGWAMLRGWKHSFFRDLRLRMGSLAEQGYAGAVLMQEGRHQLRFTFWQSLFISVVNWVYYIFFYIDVNINTPDKFFFVWMPFVLYIVGVVYMGARYFTLWMYYSPGAQGAAAEHIHNSRVRYIIVDPAHFWLAGEEEEEGLNGVPGMSRRPMLDTPASLSFTWRERVARADALRYFEEMSGVTERDGLTVRFMYTSKAVIGDSNVFHYIASVPKRIMMEKSPMRGKWYTVAQVHRLMLGKRLDPMLAAELDRLFTVTLAWKTYDREGRRLYKIKNYRPTFRLADVNNDKVDYDDPQWLRVADNNEDRPFFTIRRLWRQLTRNQSDVSK